MRRFAIGTTALALLLAQLIGCAADAPTAPTGGGGGTGNGSLQISLVTNDANPAAGTCTLIRATATLNGQSVPDGTGIHFVTSFGTFVQNSQGSVTVSTDGGAASTSVCSPQSGVANVRASATIAGQTGSASLPVSFQPSSSSAFVSFCSPSFGSPNGGTAIAIHGGGFFGSPAGTRVVFSAAGVQREGLVTGVTSTQVNVTTPGFPEANSLGVPVQMVITFGFGTGNPVTVTSANCFVFGTNPPGTATVTAVMPSSGKNNGNTRVAIVGTGFVSPLQVFFGNVEASVLSISFNQIVALTPPASGIGSGNLNQTVDVRVREVNSGQDATLPAAFRYGPAIQLISFSGANVQSVTQTFTPLTIYGQGFEAPVTVSLAGFVATVMSVSATELVVVPGNLLVNGCSDVSGSITVTNINSGDTATGLSFTYLVSGVGPVINSVSPTQAQVPGAGIQLLISGANLPTSPSNAIVEVGGQQVTVISASPAGTGLTVQLPPTSDAAPTCGANAPGTVLPVGSALDVTVTNRSTTCNTTFPAAFQYLLPCVP